MKQLHLGDFFTNRQEPGAPGLPVMSVTMNDSLVPREDLDRLTASALRPDQHLLVRRGDIAYNMMRMWQGACGLAEADGIVSPAYVVLQPKENIYSRFAYHWFKSARMIHLFWAYSHGLTEDRLRLYFDSFSEIPVVAPPLNQQKKIAAVLDAWDQAIDQAERLISANRLAYRSKLNAFAELERAPTLRLDQIAEINVRSLPASTDPKFEFDYFDIAAAEDGSERELSGRIVFKNAPSRARRLVANEAVVYSTVRPLLRRLFTAKSRPDIVYSTGYSILEPTESCMVGYLKHLLVSNLVERQVYARLTGSGYPAINENDLAEIRIPLPDIDKQAVICATLDAHEKQQSLYLRYSKALRTQKRGLMQKLLTGERRLDEHFDPSSAPRQANLGAVS
ncbi:type I restriction enzyme S subunit [Agrobacterium vitis]|nr:type I restriction enzyme S subunit [Agrobacterium vitis]MBE1440214.1 type I restriction enzyme S subunit [Agrobacterium vitis]